MENLGLTEPMRCNSITEHDVFQVVSFCSNAKMRQSTEMLVDVDAYQKVTQAQYLRRAHTKC